MALGISDLDSLRAVSNCKFKAVKECPRES
jgi:hypothetical protein